MVIIVDVLSFSTSVDIAVSRGAMVYPYVWQDDTALAYAASLGAVLAGPRRMQAGYSLSPVSLMGIPAGTRIVLPSPEARLAVAVFRAAETTLDIDLMRCGSGKELIEAGFEQDVILASMLAVSETAPVLVQNSYVRFEG